MYGQKRMAANTAGPEQRTVADTLAMAMAGLYELLSEAGPEQWRGMQDAMRQAGVTPRDMPGLWPERADAVRDALHRMHPGRLIDLALAVARKIERHTLP